MLMELNTWILVVTLLERTVLTRLESDQRSILPCPHSTRADRPDVAPCIQPSHEPADTYSTRRTCCRVAETDVTLGRAPGERVDQGNAAALISHHHLFLLQHPIGFDVAPRGVEEAERSALRKTEEVHF
ncbi:hypothetical protein V8E36_007199 [Tilletia maclaganii]